MYGSKCLPVYTGWSVLVSCENGWATAMSVLYDILQVLWNTKYFPNLLTVIVIVIVSFIAHWYLKEMAWSMNPF